MDQALSSATNFAVSVVVAREVTIREFGAFTTAFIAYTIVMGVSRSACMEAVLMRFSQVSHAEWSRATRAATGAALVVGTAAGGLSAVVGLATAGTFRAVFLALAVSLPGLILQDAWRFAFFAAERGRSAFLNDLAWAIALVPLLVLALSRGASVGPLALAWGTAATFAAIVGVFQAGLLPKPSGAIGWWRENRRLASRILGEFAAMTATAHLTLYGVGAVAGIRALAALRGAQILLGPLNVIVIGIGLVAIPEGVRLLKRSTASLRKAAQALAAALAACALTLGTVLVLLPERIGESVLGRTWGSARHVVFPIAICLAFWGITMGALLGLRVLGRFDQSLRARLISSAISLLGAILGAAFGGAEGAAWVWAVSLGVGSAIWWREFGMAAKKHERESLESLDAHVPSLD